MPPTIRNSPLPAGTPPRTLTLLVVGSPIQSAENWPQPLPQLLARNLLHLTQAADLFQAAALLKQRRFLALLVDPEALSRAELKMMATVKRHVVLPLWSLPTRNRKALVSESGLLPWEEAARTLSQILLPRYTPDLPEGNSTNAQTLLPAPPAPLPAPASPPPLAGPKPHNPPPAASEKPLEIPVASQLADRYDESTSLPLLSEHELRALLGPTNQGSDG